jgi:hypothetical protein
LWVAFLLLFVLSYPKAFFGPIEEAGNWKEMCLGGGGSIKPGGGREQAKIEKGPNKTGHRIHILWANAKKQFFLPFAFLPSFRLSSLFGGRLRGNSTETSGMEMDEWGRGWPQDWDGLGQWNEGIWPATIFGKEKGGLEPKVIHIYFSDFLLTLSEAENIGGGEGKISAFRQSYINNDWFLCADVSKGEGEGFAQIDLRKSKDVDSSRLLN